MKEYMINNKDKIRYHDLPGEDTTIIFIHGLGCSGSFDYPEVAAQKELSNHRRILVDLLGSGFSDKPEDFTYTVKDHANYLYDLLQELNINKIIIFGHSLGGPIAIELANLCEDMVENLIISEGNLDKSEDGAVSFMIGKIDEKNFKDKIFYDIVNKNSKDNSLWAANLSVCSPIAISRISKVAIKGGEPSWRQILYDLKCSKTFIIGERTLVDFPEVTKEKQELSSKGINIETIEKAGHSMAWENPKGLAEAIKRGIDLGLQK